LRHSRRPLIIAARGSPLARVQAESIGRFHGELDPAVEIQYRWIETAQVHIDQDDQDGQDNRESAKDVFVRGVEEAVLTQSADVAVHSLKDLPVTTRPDARRLIVIAVPPRADARDCLVGHHGPVPLDQLPHGATVGTSSPRRKAQLLRRRGDLQIAGIDGNVQTRLSRVQQQREFDATVLAVAGLQRLGLGHLADGPLSVEAMAPAAGQGALALQCRADDHTTIRRCLQLNDATSAAAVHAERQIVLALGADCRHPLGVYVAIDGDEVELTARVLSPDGRDCVDVIESGEVEQLPRLVNGVIKSLRGQGAEQMLNPS